MAAPVADSYSAVSGGGVYGGRYNWPAWRQGLAVGTWSEIPTTLLSSIDPKDSATHNPNYPSTAPWLLKSAGTVNITNNDGVMQPWCGGCWDDATGTFWLPLGGGHADYGGNEPYKICLADESPAWSMVRPPSGSATLISGGLPPGSTPQGSSYLLDDGQETSGVYADGRPRAIHSYRKHVYAPGIGPVMTVQGGCFTSTGESNKHTWVLDEGTGEWEWKATADSALFATSSGGAACYDTTRDCVYWVGAETARILKLDLSTWTFSSIGDVVQATGDVFIEHIAEHDVIINVCSYYANDFIIRDPVTGAVSTPSVSGTAPSLTGATCMAWVPSVGLVCYTSGIVYVLAPTGNPKTDSWVWSQMTTTGTPPNATGGAYSKFGYSQKMRGIYRFTNSGHKPWFLPLE